MPLDFDRQNMFCLKERLNIQFITFGKFKHNSEDLTGLYVGSIQSVALEGTILNTSMYKIMRNLSLFMQSELLF